MTSPARSTADTRLTGDRFTRDVRRGRVIGSRAAEGTTRLGVDRHRSLSIDGSALRITSLTTPGWGDTVVAYGPFPSSRGLAFGAYVLNGHNSAQSEPLGESLATRFKRWLKGNEEASWPAHLRAWVRHGRTAWTLRRFRHWIATDLAERRGTLVLLDENLGLGFARHIGSDPRIDGCSFVMHASGADNGELWLCVDGATRRVLAGVRAVPLYLVIAFRDDTAVAYGASLAGVRGLPSLPALRPLAVVALPPGDEFFAALHQSVSGQIGFAADTRVWEASTASVAAWLDSDGGPAVVAAPSGDERSTWSIDGGAGLIRVVGEAGWTGEVSWRGSEHACYTVELRADGCVLRRRRGDAVDVVVQDDLPHGGDRRELQISDDGGTVGVFADGELLFGGWIDAGIEVDGEDVAVRVDDGRGRGLEIFPRRVRVPEVLAPTNRPVELVRPPVEALVDEFDGASGELGGRRIGDAEWTRTIGSGRFVLTGAGGVRVDASPARPAPGRIAYTIPCAVAGPVTQEIEVLPPGTGRGDGERGRAGVVFEQDPDNALIVNTWLDDHYGGASISSFVRLGGFEDLYDAVWTNVGSRISWGRRYVLAATFDGSTYQISVDGEVVLFRRLEDIHRDQGPLQIRRVGIAANWEWGTDTGSVFHRYALYTGSAGRRDPGAAG